MFIWKWGIDDLIQKKYLKMDALKFIQMFRIRDSKEQQLKKE